MYLESDKSFRPTPEFLKKKKAKVLKFPSLEGWIKAQYQSISKAYMNIFKVSKARGVVKDWLMCNSDVFSTREMYVLWEAFPKVLLSGGVTWLANWV